MKTGTERKRADLSLLFLVLLLLVLGLVLLYSTSAYNGRVKFQDPAYYFKKQLFATTLGLLALYLVSQMDYHRIARLAWPIYGASLLLSTLVLFVGREYNGSKRWLALGPLSFQPAEFAKVAVVIFLARQISESKKRPDSFRFMARTMAMLLPIVGLVGTNNLSTAVIILGIGVILIFVSNPRYLPFVGIGARGWRLWEFSSVWRATGWSGWPSGEIRRPTRKGFRPSRDCTPSAAAAFSEGGWEAVCRSWGLCRRPRTI